MMRSENMSSRARIGAVVLAAMAAIALSGCGQKKDVASTDASGGEVVAKVNGDELTANQLTIALQKQRGMRPDAGPLLDGSGPGAYVLEGDQRHGRHAVRAMAVLAAPLQNRGDIPGECHVTRRSGGFGLQNERRHKANHGWDEQR